MSNQGQQTTISAWWLIGAGLLLFGVLTLFLALGWLRYLEAISIGVGLAIYGGLFLAYFLLNRHPAWTFWAAYLFLSGAALFTVVQLTGLSALLYALAMLLLALPFIGLYVLKVAIQHQRAYWWLLFPAGGSISIGAALLQIWLRWPLDALPGVLMVVFMGTMAGMLIVMWLPNREDEEFTWAPLYALITVLIAALGALLMIGEGRLALPLLLIGLSLLTFSYVTLEQLFRPGAIRLTSVAFQNGEHIPARYTCEGEMGVGISPPLRWTNLPPEARSLALICYSPDARRDSAVHWLLYDLAPTVTELPERIPPDETVSPEVIPGGAKQGPNSGGRLGYRGPCPPAGPPMRYVFRLYALDRRPSLNPNLSYRQLHATLRRHSRATGELMGRFKRG